MGNTSTQHQRPAFESAAAQHSLRTESGRHALEKVMELSLRCIAREQINTDLSVGEITMGKEPLPRDLMQIGYNLGRLSEITGAGRMVWDSTKGFVERKDWASLFQWAEALAGPVENAGCDCCGMNDREAGSKQCADCNAEGGAE